MSDVKGAQVSVTLSEEDRSILEKMKARAADKKSSLPSLMMVL